MPEAPKKESDFLGDVLKLVLGTGFAQALTIAVSPLLTRLYGPEDFGVFALFISITTIIISIACLRYEPSIVLPTHDHEAANLLGVSFGFAIITSLITAITIWLIGSDNIAALFRAPTLSPYIWLVIPTIFFGGVFLVFTQWNSRQKHFGRTSVATVIQSLVTTATQLGLGYAGAATEGSLIIARVLGIALPSCLLGCQIWLNHHSLFRESLHWRVMLSGIKRYYKFPLYNTWATLLNSVSWQLPAMMLAIFFSPEIVGYYSLSHRILTIPMFLVGDAIRQVFFQRAAEAANQSQVREFTEKSFQKLVEYGLFPMLILTFIGEDVFTTVFGNEWSIAGTYSQILSFYMFFNFLASPLGQLFSTLEKQEIAMATNIILLFSRFLALLVGGYTGNIILTFILYSLSGTVIYGLYSLIILKIAGLSIKFWFTTISKSIFESGSLIAIAWTICYFLDIRSWMQILMYSVTAIIYYIIIVCREKNLLPTL